MIKISNLNKTYKGDKVALKEINVNVEKGSFIGILGPNGAGKSTLINIIAGNVKKSSGEIKIDGIDFDEREIDTKKLLGIVPQEITFDPFFTVNEVLEHQSGYFGVRNNQEYINSLLEDLSLMDKKHTSTKALSGGMKRRLLIAKALVHKPKVFILDEPTAGVDIELRHSLYNFLRKIHKEGTTIILTTHYLEEAELLCERVVILNGGKVVADDKTDNLIKELGENLEVRFHFSENQDCEIVKKFIFEYKGEIEKDFIKMNLPREGLPDLFEKIKQSKIKYSNFRVLEPKLEDVFLKLTTKQE